MLIRIEHIETGFGLFQSQDEYGNIHTDELSFIEELDKKHESFPTPNGDLPIGRYIKENEFCAFKSIKQLKEWIEPRWFEEIASIGFRIYALHVKKCVIGEYQVLFEKENILRKTDITDLILTSIKYDKEFLHEKEMNLSCNS